MKIFIVLLLLVVVSSFASWDALCGFMRAADVLPAEQLGQKEAFPCGIPVAL